MLRRRRRVQWLLKSSSLLKINCPWHPGSPIAYFTLGYNQQNRKITLSWLLQAKKGSFTDHPAIAVVFMKPGKGCWSIRISASVALSPVPCLPRWGSLQMPSVQAGSRTPAEAWEVFLSSGVQTWRPAKASTKGWDDTLSSPLARGGIPGPLCR